MPTTIKYSLTMHTVKQIIGCLCVQHNDTTLLPPSSVQTQVASVVLHMYLCDFGLHQAYFRLHVGLILSFQNILGDLSVELLLRSCTVRHPARRR